MQPESPTPEPEQKWYRLTTVTKASKYVALVLFILLPFVGGYVGYNLATKEADMRDGTRMLLREEEEASWQADLRATRQAEEDEGKTKTEDEDKVNLDYVRQFVDISEYSFASFEEFEETLTESGDRFYRTDVKNVLRKFGYENLMSLPAFHIGRDKKACSQERKEQAIIKLGEVFSNTKIETCNKFLVDDQLIISVFPQMEMPDRSFRYYLIVNLVDELEYPQMLNDLDVRRINNVNIGITEGSLYRYDAATNEMILVYKYRPNFRYNTLNQAGPWINFCASQCESLRLVSQERNSILIGVQDGPGWASEASTVELFEINFNDDLTEYSSRLIYGDRDSAVIRWSQPLGQPQYRTDIEQ